MFCFFFKQKAAYEMRISDWSSDVCSSDLFITNQQQAMPAIAPRRMAPNGPELPAAGVTATRPAIAPEQAPSSDPLWPSARSVSIQKRTPAAVAVKRPDERRVGKGCVSTC